MTPKHAASCRPYPVEALEPRLLLSSYTVTNVDDSGAGSLRADVLMSNASPGANSITFTPGLSGTITLTTGQLEIASNLAIVGPGAGSLTVSGNMQIRVFQVDAGVTASIWGLTITGGRAPTGGMGVNGDAGNRTAGPGGAGGNGGGIYNLGSLSLANDVVSGNSAGAGGGGGEGWSAANLGGSAGDGGNGGSGGNGGGIFNAGSLAVTNGVVTGNSAGAGALGGYPGYGGSTGLASGGNGGNGGAGGAIYSTGPLTLSGATISHNTAGPGGAGAGAGEGAHVGGGGAGGGGGGIWTSGHLGISTCTVDSNSAGAGGATGTGLSNNAGGAGGPGGGIDAVSGDAIITGSTISRNAAGDGGYTLVSGPPLAGWGGGIHSDGEIALVNDTVSGNRAGDAPPEFFASRGSGGGIDSTGMLRLTTVTVSGNHTGTSNATPPVPAVGGGILSRGDTVMNNTIVAGNGVGDVYGPIDQSSAYNLIGNGTGMSAMSPANHNQVGDEQNPINAKVGPLSDNGGPTQTVALLAGSPAIDAGSNNLAVGTDGKRLVADQRGYYRIFNGAVDIGAHEFGSPPLLPGDANGDGRVGFADVIIVARHYGTTNATWADGDFNGDGSVGFDDLVVLARNYGRTVPLSSDAASSTAATANELPMLAQLSRRRIQHRGSRAGRLSVAMTPIAAPQ